MLPDRVSNPGPLTYESGALPIAPRGPAVRAQEPSRIQCEYKDSDHTVRIWNFSTLSEIICQTD